MEKCGSHTVKMLLLPGEYRRMFEESGPGFKVEKRTAVAFMRRNAWSIKWMRSNCSCPRLVLLRSDACS
ncbi:hypothetical protein KQX54_006716 [Cotesia glomerata]|uniref:Uncharacterized protein n=1 Tax=Cotesia glomerata TaxID=32391 RepID=A0AAV7IYY4_COTGL|nr:hypothetical protein KQX54_006716 [Cotesia glomerata]